MRDVEDLPRTAAQLRAAIDSGAGVGKSNALDPAAAPMETDAEAGGAPPTALEIESAYANEIRSSKSRSRESANTSMPFRKSRGLTTSQISVLSLASLLVFVVVVMLSGA